MGKVQCSIATANNPYPYLDTLGDLDNYSPQLVDGGVVGWPIHYTTPSRRKGLREIEFILKAQVLNTRTETVIKENTQDTVKTDVKDEL